MSETLLHQIQMEAVDHQHDLPSLLRKCRVLAQRLANDDLKAWVVSELDGYAHTNALPPYRVLKQALLLGHYFGVFQSELRNVQIPASAVPEKIRDLIMGVSVTQGVREIQEQIANSENGTIRLAVPPEAFGVIKHTGVREDMVLASVAKHVSTSFLQGILDTVRNRVLNFTLELESEASSAGDPLEDLRMKKSDKVQQIFNTEIKGNVANFAQGSSEFSQTANISQGDEQGLKNALVSGGLSDALASELVQTAKAERPSKDGFGNRVLQLLGKVSAGVYDGMSKVPGAVAAAVAVEALKKYYGM